MPACRCWLLHGGCGRRSRKNGPHARHVDALSPLRGPSLDRPLRPARGARPAPCSFHEQRRRCVAEHPRRPHARRQSDGRRHSRLRERSSSCGLSNTSALHLESRGAGGVPSAARAGWLHHEPECRLKRRDGSVVWCLVNAVISRKAGDRTSSTARSSIDRPPFSAGPAPAGAEDGSHRAARRRRGPRLQQPADRDPRLHASSSSRDLPAAVPDGRRRRSNPGAQANARAT